MEEKLVGVQVAKLAKEKDLMNLVKNYGLITTKGNH